MRLITHNMLKCNVKGVENGYPLTIVADEVAEVEPDNPFDLDFMRGLLRKINLTTVKKAAADMQMEELLSGVDLDKDKREALLADEDALRKMYHLLFELDIQTGMLVCPESGREFHITDGIPNMLLHEDEI